MLEHLDKSQILPSKNSENRDNQQEKLKLSWLAGMLEGDGFVSVTISKSKLARNGFGTRAVIGVTNQDSFIINEVDNILRSIGVTACIQENKTPKGIPIFLISTSKNTYVKKVLDSIIPYLIGDKKARAELTLKFVNRRVSKPYSYLEQEDIDLLREMNEKFVNRKGKLTDSARILRDCTLSDSGIESMIQSELTGDSKNTAEMSVSAV